MTVHSPSGTDPEAFGVRRRNAHVHAFANNEVAFVENRGYDIRLVGEGLDEALRHYMAGRRARPSGSQVVRRENATHDSGRLAHSRSDDPARRIASVRRKRKGRVDRSSSRPARGRPRAARRLVCKETEIQAGMRPNFCCA